MTSRWRCDPPAAAAFRVGGCSPTARSLPRGTEIEQTISYRKDVALLFLRFSRSPFLRFSGSILLRWHNIRRLARLIVDDHDRPAPQLPPHLRDLRPRVRQVRPIAADEFLDQRFEHF